MFTGLITDLGRLNSRQASQAGATLTIATNYDIADLELGESIAVDGACLTVTSLGTETFTIDASSETLSRTTLGDRSTGDKLHLERALRLSDRLGGHLVTGHIDGVGVIKSRRRDGNAWLFEVEAPPAVVPYLIEKGSVAVDGISLTVNAVAGSRFDLAIIPHTADKTLIADYQPGRRVNLEADLIGKFVRKFVGDARGEGLSLADLTGAGFT